MRWMWIYVEEANNVKYMHLCKVCSFWVVVVSNSSSKVQLLIISNLSMQIMYLCIFIQVALP
jgi:hypothetical protein